MASSLFQISPYISSVLTSEEREEIERGVLSKLVIHSYMNLSNQSKQSMGITTDTFCKSILDTIPVTISGAVFDYFNKKKDGRLSYEDFVDFCYMVRFSSVNLCRDFEDYLEENISAENLKSDTTEVKVSNDIASRIYSNTRDLVKTIFDNVGKNLPIVMENSIIAESNYFLSIPEREFKSLNNRLKPSNRLSNRDPNELSTINNESYFLGGRTDELTYHESSFTSNHDEANEIEANNTATRLTSLFDIDNQEVYKNSEITQPLRLYLEKKIYSSLEHAGTCMIKKKKIENYETSNQQDETREMTVLVIEGFIFFYDSGKNSFSIEDYLDYEFSAYLRTCKLVAKKQVSMNRKKFSFSLLYNSESKAVEFIADNIMDYCCWVNNLRKVVGLFLEV